MANTRAPRYTVQITPTVEPEIAGELAAWAEVTGETAAAMARAALYKGIALQRDEWRRAHGPLPADVLTECVQRAQERGDRQIAAKRERDARMRDGASAL